LGLAVSEPDLTGWRGVVRDATKKHARRVRIGLIAKYLGNVDTYYSVIEALRTAAVSQNVGIEVVWINAEDLEDNSPKSARRAEAWEALSHVDGILVPGGFGTRGVNGKIAAADWALDRDVPYLGICLGLQTAVIAAARRGGLTSATSGELDPKSKAQVVYIMAGQKEMTGGTMRLGDYSAVLQSGSLVERIYRAGSDAPSDRVTRERSSRVSSHGSSLTFSPSFKSLPSNESESADQVISERHRHRYEVNRAHELEINRGGLVVSGQSPDGQLVEFVEAPNHKFFVATQAHPEFKSRPMRPHPLFVGLIQAAKENNKGGK
jgi:CTP synthase